MEQISGSPDLLSFIIFLLFKHQLFAIYNMFQQSSRVVHQASSFSIRQFSSATSKLSITDFVKLLKQEKQHRGYIVFDEKSKKLKSSHPVLDDLGK